MSTPEKLPAPDVFVRTDAHTGGAPAYDRRTNTLLWVDIGPSSVLHRTALASGADRVDHLDTVVGAVVPRSGGDLVAAVADGFATIDDGVLDLVIRELPQADRHMSGAAADRAGRLWAGSTTRRELPGEGALHRWQDSRGTDVVLDGLTRPGGPAWSPDNRTVYVADTSVGRVYAAPFDLDDGTVGHHRVFAQFAADEGAPTSVCVDADGCLWLPLFGSGTVRRYDPMGEHIATMPVPVSRPTACAFGPDTTLYLTSARTGLSEAELAEEPLAGSVLAVDVGTEGTPVGVFAG